METHDAPAATDGEHVAAPIGTVPEPHDGECLLCYVDRMLDSSGCDTTLRWARRWRDHRAPAAQGLERRLGARGGFCDCEIFLNGWDCGRTCTCAARTASRPGPARGPPARG